MIDQQEQMQTLANRLLHPHEPYVVFCQSQIPGALGETSPSLHLLHYPALLARGEWRGPRPTVSVDPDAIARHVRQHVAGPADAERLDPLALASVVVHELAHVAETAPSDVEPTEPNLRFSQALAAYAVVSDGLPDVWPPFLQHGAHFIRAALHLHYRAKGYDVNFPEWMLADTTGYGLSPIWEYANALANEPAQMLGLSPFDIRLTIPPREFVALCRSDVKAWHDGQADLTETTRRYCDQALSLFEV